MTSHEWHAFLSYARVDEKQVDPVQAKLEAAGIPVWRDTVLRPGQFWADRVEEAIAVNAFVFIAFFSRASLFRVQGFQFAEMRRAIEQLQSRNPDYPWLIPVRLDDCEIPKYDLGAGQTLAGLWHADLFGPGYDRELAGLVEAIEKSQKQLEALEEFQRQEAAARSAAAGPAAVAPPSETQPETQPGRRRAGALGRWRSGGTRALVATVAVLAVAGGVLVYIYVVPPAAAPGSASGSASGSAPASASTAASVSASVSAPASASGQVRRLACRTPHTRSRVASTASRPRRGSR